MSKRSKFHTNWLSCLKSFTIFKSSNQRQAKWQLSTDENLKKKPKKSDFYQLVRRLVYVVRVFLSIFLILKQNHHLVSPCLQHQFFVLLLNEVKKKVFFPFFLSFFNFNERKRFHRSVTEVSVKLFFLSLPHKENGTSSCLEWLKWLFNVRNAFIHLTLSRNLGLAQHG